MKNLMSLAVAVACLASAAVANAEGPRLVLGRGIDLSMPRLVSFRQGAVVPEPVPVVGGAALSGPVLVMDSLPVPYEVGECELFPCVKYKDCRKIAPCAVPMIVSVKDPCACKTVCNSCCEPKCVNVKICVPPCDCPDVKITRNGNRVTYCFGCYAVHITSKNGIVVVNYDS